MRGRRAGPWTSNARLPLSAETGFLKEQFLHVPNEGRELFTAFPLNKIVPFFLSFPLSFFFFFLSSFFPLLLFSRSVNVQNQIIHLTC